jgi:hypothetical protein
MTGALIFEADNIKLTPLLSQIKTLKKRITRLFGYPFYLTHML